VTNNNTFKRNGNEKKGEKDQDNGKDSSYYHLSIKNKRFLILP
jgi:hypothetical protein